MKHMPIARRLLTAVALSIATASASAAGSHSGGHGHDKGHAKDKGHGHGASAAMGEPGKASEVSRTIQVKMLDNYYEPKSIAVSDGETVRFVVTNAGKLVHEFNIANASMHAAHQKEMLGMMQSGMLLPDRIDHSKMHGHGAMAHDDPNSVLLEPGKSGEIVWQFASATDLEFACNVPGHYAAGMHGNIKVK